MENEQKNFIFKIWKSMFQKFSSEKNIGEERLKKFKLLFKACALVIYADKKLNGQDPEFFNTGGVASPVPKQFTLTLRLGL